ncbi:MAG TPA: hypothetical protein VGH98_25245 [Gemmatimonadaceae bacterium]|jgi:hypothetical protein
MRNQTNRAWSVGAAAIVLAAGVFTLGGCDRIKNELLEPQNPGLVDQSAVNSAAAAAALKIGAIGRLKVLSNDPSATGFAYSSLWVASGLFSDEFSNSDFQNSQNDVDARTISPDNVVSDYSRVTQSRGFIRDAITAERQWEPQKTTDIAELYLGLGFLEMSLGEDFCNGIPLGSNKAGVADYSSPDFKPLTNQQVYVIALAHVDTAISTIGTATDAASTFVMQAALITRARIMIDQNRNQAGAAAALVPTTVVPSTYQYLWTSSTASNGDDIGIWRFNNSVGRTTVGDSTINFQGKIYTTLNAIPFASAKDPRVPVLDGKGAGLSSEDGLTPFFLQQIWKNRDDPVPMVSGIDARLIEAEAALNASTPDITTMMTILNALRATPPKIGTYQPAAMAPLATPATTDDATTLFFREKAFWTFGRGQRMGDLRRLVRQYGRTQDKVFPSGQQYKGVNYGADVNFPVPDGERVNPQFQGCIDRSA